MAAERQSAADPQKLLNRRERRESQRAQRITEGAEKQIPFPCALCGMNAFCRRVVLKVRPHKHKAHENELEPFAPMGENGSNSFCVRPNHGRWESLIQFQCSSNVLVTMWVYYGGLSKKQQGKLVSTPLFNTS